MRILKVKPREISGWIALLLGAGFWMVVAASIGDQQFSAADGTLLVGRHLLWGVLAVLGYAVVPAVLFVRLGPSYGGRGRTTKTAMPSGWMALLHGDDLGRVSVGLPDARAFPARAT